MIYSCSVSSDFFSFSFFTPSTIESPGDRFIVYFGLVGILVPETSAENCCPAYCICAVTAVVILITFFAFFHLAGTITFFPTVLGIT